MSSGANSEQKAPASATIPSGPRPAPPNHRGHKTTQPRFHRVPKALRLQEAVAAMFRSGPLRMGSEYSLTIPLRYGQTV